MATTYADRRAKGFVSWTIPLEDVLAARAERFILPNRRAEFVRRAIEREVERLERRDATREVTVEGQVADVETGLKNLRLKHGRR